MADGTYYTASAIHSKSLKQLGDYEERKRLEVEQMLLEEWNSGWKLWGTEGLKTVEGFMQRRLRVFESTSRTPSHAGVELGPNKISKGMLRLVISLLLPITKPIVITVIIRIER